MIYDYIPDTRIPEPPAIPPLPTDNFIMGYAPPPPPFQQRLVRRATRLDVSSDETLTQWIESATD